MSQLPMIVETRRNERPIGRQSLCNLAFRPMPPALPPPSTPVRLHPSHRMQSISLFTIGMGLACAKDIVQCRLV